MSQFEEFFGQMDKMNKHEYYHNKIKTLFQLTSNKNRKLKSQSPYSTANIMLRIKRTFERISLYNTLRHLQSSTRMSHASKTCQFVGKRYPEREYSLRVHFKREYVTISSHCRARLPIFFSLLPNQGGE